MKKFFVAIVDEDSTSAQRNLFTAYLRDQKVGFWHHIAHGWLIVDSSGRLTSSALRDKIRELMPTVNSMVIKAKPKGWAGLAPKPGHKWLEDNLSEKLWP